MRAVHSGKTQKPRVKNPAKPYLGKLLKPIDIIDARPTGLAAALGLTPDDAALRNFFDIQFQERWDELDKFFGLSSTKADIWELRAKALAARHLDAPPPGPNWWKRWAEKLAAEHVPGFVIIIESKSRGTPKKWADYTYAQILADVEVLRQRTSLSASNLARSLCVRKDYNERWGKFSPAALERAYFKSAEMHRTDELFRVKLYGTTLPRGADPVPLAIEIFSFDAEKRRLKNSRNK